MVELAFISFSVGKETNSSGSKSSPCFDRKGQTATSIRTAHPKKITIHQPHYPSIIELTNNIPVYCLYGDSGRKHEAGAKQSSIRQPSLQL